jgi:hypothetical protein
MIAKSAIASNKTQPLRRVTVTTTKLLAAATVLLCSALSASAQANSIQWRATFPKKGDTVGCIYVSGTVTYSAGWSIKPVPGGNRYVTVVCTEVNNETNKLEFNVLLDTTATPHEWGGTTGIELDLGAANSGKTFNCLPKALFTNGTAEVPIAGQSSQATAK